MTDREIIEWARDWAKASAICGDVAPAERYRRLAELAERGLAAEQWQPIATAPNDDTPPVVLRGLVKGGEYASADEWADSVSPMDALCLAADGRIVNDFNHAAEAEARGDMPITWYRYEETP